MKTAILLCLTGSFLVAQTRYEPTWESIDKRPNPAWFAEAKFGIFIHWGIYSVPAFAPVNKKGETPYSEWYWNSLTKGQREPKGNATSVFHSRVFGPQFPYQDFAPMFKAELFDAGRWADVFLRSGAKYVVPTSKHHDGFAIWPSAHASKTWGRPWNSVEIGPKRDLLGELTDAVRRKGLKAGFYYSLYEWYNPLWISDKKRFVDEHMFPQFKDVVTRYKPSIIFSDGEWDLTSAEWKSPELLAWLFNESPSKDEVVIDDRWGKDTRHKHGGYWTTEYTPGLDLAGHDWEESRGMGHSYGYNRVERLEDYHSGRELVLMLVDLVSRGGSVLLDIGPAADGTIPVVMEDRLIQIGDWLKVNGEAIYGTRPWKKTRQWSAGKVPTMETNKEYMVRYEVTDLVDGAGPGMARVESFFTSKGDTLYAIVPGWPARQFVIQNVKARKSMTATLLGHESPLKWKAAGGGVQVEVPEFGPALRPCCVASVIKLAGVE
ncbi:MAG: alpha-L-fucosidase [Bryobacterales bacterium]|nr:alpha-L-fucosidase [Bryobacterales bacterium]